MLPPIRLFWRSGSTLTDTPPGAIAVEMDLGTLQKRTWIIRRNGLRSDCFIFAFLLITIVVTTAATSSITQLKPPPVLPATPRRTKPGHSRPSISSQFIALDLHLPSQPPHYPQQLTTILFFSFFFCFLPFP